MLLAWVLSSCNDTDALYRLHGRWVRTNKTKASRTKQHDISLAPPVHSPESDSDGVYATLPPGPYVPAWLHWDEEEENSQDDAEMQAGGQEPHRSAASLADLDVREYLLSQKEDAAAEFQLRAQVLSRDHCRHALLAGYFLFLWKPDRWQSLLTWVEWFACSAGNARARV